MKKSTPKPIQPELPYPKLCECGCGLPVRNRFARGHSAIRPVEDRFWEKVDIRGPDDCWEWKAYRDPSGYGRFLYESKAQKASRVAYILTNGPIPDGMKVLHSCDNPPCCNPRHLSEGTQSDNVHDMVTKGRMNHTNNVKGEAVNTSRLCAAQVIEIRRLCAMGVSQRQVARQFGVAQPSVGRIVRRENWKHLE